MQTLRTQSFGSTSRQVQQSDRLSKLEQWMQENKRGILTPTGLDDALNDVRLGKVYTAKNAKSLIDACLK